jgi:hypothetical protein
MKHLFRIVVFLFIGGSVLACTPSANPTTASAEATLDPNQYPMTPFMTVRGFAFNRGKKGRPDCHTPLNKDGTLCKSVEKPGVVLNAAQQKRLLALLGTRKTFGDGETKCFIPHHGFVFYDKEDKPVAQVSICFLCAGLRASPRLPAQPKNPRYSGLGEAGMKNLRQLCADVGLPDSQG